ncbi:hypothetical protein Ciccas_007919 [Cichlidogyrus casuarinus]|uniref:Uncharacterized protein n=1 Tax=Cichlidogyrus casuarinus TaxID=1844966 RepID=A0ABD2Q1G5_9PLAT
MSGEYKIFQCPYCSADCTPSSTVISSEVFCSETCFSSWRRVQFKLRKLNQLPLASDGNSTSTSIGKPLGPEAKITVPKKRAKRVLVVPELLGLMARNGLYPQGDQQSTTTQTELAEEALDLSTKKSHKREK